MDTIIVLDFGGQYCHLICRRIKDLGVYCQVMPSNTNIDDLKKIKNLKAIILSGGAYSVYDEHSPKCSSEILNIGLPILGICYGHQLIAYWNKGKINSAKSGEYGLTQLKILKKTKLLNGINNIAKVWMNHRDVVEKLPNKFEITASTNNCPIACFENDEDKIYGIQFHPEVSHTTCGDKILKNFAFDIAKAKKQWNISNFIEEANNEIKQKLQNKKAIIGLSGGVDSSATAILVGNIIKENLTAVYVDTGLMRHKETEFIEQIFSKYPLNLNIIYAKNRFLEALKGITEPEQKRKIIGKLFIDIFSEVAKKENANILIQGTIYSDRIESGITKNSSTIKSHHNVGGLPKDLKLQIYEPLRDLYKDEVRKLAKQLKLPKEIIKRQVFPGPGLAIRIIGEVTEQKAQITRMASHIIETELKKANLYDDVWMSFAVLLPIKSVGIQGDERTYKYPIVVRIIDSIDAMTANFSRIPYDVLENISTRITNEIKDVNRVVYDISNKPPSTMEWE